MHVTLTLTCASGYAWLKDQRPGNRLFLNVSEPTLGQHEVERWIVSTNLELHPQVQVQVQPTSLNCLSTGKRGKKVFLGYFAYSIGVPLGLSLVGLLMGIYGDTGMDGALPPFPALSCPLPPSPALCCPLLGVPIVCHPLPPFSTLHLPIARSSALHCFALFRPLSSPALSNSKFKALLEETPFPRGDVCPVRSQRMPGAVPLC